MADPRRRRARATAHHPSRQERDRFLVQLDDHTRALEDPREITAAAARLLGQHLQVNRCAYAHVARRDSFELTGDYCNGVPSIVGQYALAEFGPEFTRLTLAGDPFVVTDSETDPRTTEFVEVYRRTQIRAVISIPLLKQGGFAGGMAVHQLTPRTWRPDEIELVRIVANRCWEAIERARIARGLERRARSLSFLAENGMRLLSEDRPQMLIESLFEKAAELAELELCFHYVPTKDGRLRLAVSRGVDEKTSGRIQYLEFGEAVCGLVALGQEPVICASVQTGSDEMTTWIRPMGVRAYACFPLVSGGVLLGTLSFASRSRDTFDESDLEFLHTLSDQVAAAYARANATAAMRDSEERLQQAVAIARLGTFDIDLRTDAVAVNGPGRAIYGWSSDEALTFRKVQTHFHPDDRTRVMQEVMAALDSEGSGAFDVEHRIIRADGAHRWIRVRGRTIFEGAAGRRQAARCLGTYLDVTDRKEAEERRERTLQAERDARAEAERVGRLKDEFLATLSHELRTPLNAILGWSQVIRRKPMGPEQQRAALETIERNARAQAELINDLLDMSRIVSGRIRLDVQNVDLGQLVATAAESLRPAAEAKKIEVRGASDVPAALVPGDPVRLHQVVWNLLNNAIKFTPRRGRIDLRLQRSGPNVDLVVSDTGVGIAPDFLPHIFEPFRQQDASTTRRHAGVGLGLSIVKQLVELHGGTVTATSAGEGHGATFVVTLPTVAGAQGAEPSTEEVPPLLDAIRVMVVDDERDTRDLLRQVLQDAGATVFTAQSGTEALSRLQRETIDLLISDIAMADGDGYELIRQLRSMPGGQANVPAIAVTAYARNEDRDRALQAGYQLHVPKPVNVDELLQFVASVRRPRSAP